MKETQLLQREDGGCHIALLEDEPEVIRLLVEYLYCLDYEPLGNVALDNGSSLGDSSDSTFADRRVPIIDPDLEFELEIFHPPYEVPC